MKTLSVKYRWSLKTGWTVFEIFEFLQVDNVLEDNLISDNMITVGCHKTQIVVLYRLDCIGYYVSELRTKIKKTIRLRDHVVNQYRLSCT